MNRRTQIAYNAVFDFINAKVLDMNGTKEFYTDYEVALRNALREKFPSSKLKGCIFHLTQAVKRNASKIKGLVEFIRQNEAAQKIYYKLMYLAMLPANQIIPMFNSLKDSAKELNNEQLDSFFSYYRRQWITKEGPQKISVFQNEIRTTSSAEGYNRALNQYCMKKASFSWFCVSIRNQEFMKRAEFAGFVESGGIVGNGRKKIDKVILKTLNKIQ